MLSVSELLKVIYLLVLVCIWQTEVKVVSWFFYLIVFHSFIDHTCTIALSQYYTIFSVVQGVHRCLCLNALLRKEAMVNNTQCALLVLSHKSGNVAASGMDRLVWLCFRTRTFHETICEIYCLTLVSCDHFFLACLTISLCLYMSTLEIFRAKWIENVCTAWHHSWKIVPGADPASFSSLKNKLMIA